MDSLGPPPLHSIPVAGIQKPGAQLRPKDPAAEPENASYIAIS